jgi:hypothetical protein
MRPLPLLLGLSGALVAPAAALALGAATGDGSLVVKNGSASFGTPVVVLQITGSVIGQIDHGKLVIDPGVNGDAPQVTGAEWRGDSTKSDTAQVYRGNDFKFRAVGGKYTVLVYGSGVDLVAVGKGTVKLTGLPGTPVGDGKYSLNGGDFLSLPDAASKQLTIESNGP